MDSAPSPVAAAPTGVASPDDVVEAQLKALAVLIAAIIRNKRVNAISIQVLRGAAFLGAAGAALTSPTVAAVALASVSMLALVVELLLSSHRLSAADRAVHELRELRSELQVRWDKVRLTHPDPAAPQRVAHATAMLDEVQAKRDEIARYVATPGVDRPRSLG